MRAVFTLGDYTTYNLVRFICRNFPDIHVEQLHSMDEFIALSRLIYPLMVFIDASGNLRDEGYYLAWCMKSDSKLHRIPLVGLSDNDHSLEQLRQAPCNYCYKKPMPLKETQDILQNLMDEINFRSR